MVSRETVSGGERHLTDSEKELLQMLESVRHRRSEAPQVTDPGVEYAKLVSKAELADGVWYRGYPGARIHEFVLELINPSIERRYKAYDTEAALQGEFPVAFNVRFSPLLGKEKTSLRRRGYKWVPGMEKDAPHNPL